MPNKDGTGPDGKGAKTGMQFGKCEGADPDVGLGRGFGRMCPRGRRLRSFREE